MKTVQEFEKVNKKIDELVKEKVVSDNPELLTTFDGIIYPEKYCKAKYKILWILKEPYADFDENDQPCGGGWDFKEEINKKLSIKDFTKSRIFKPMIYVSWGILHEFTLWDDMNDFDKDPTMINALKSIAYINVKKLPGNTSSFQPVIANAYQQYKDILLKQVRDYEPDIIIGGSTLDFFLSDLGIDVKEKLLRYEDSFPFYLKGKQIFINAHHPSQRFNQQNYCDDIIITVKIWAMITNSINKI